MTHRAFPYFPLSLHQIASMDPNFAISTDKEDLIATALAKAPDQAISSGAHSVFALSSATLLAAISIPLLLMPSVLFNSLFALFVEKVNGLQLVEGSTIQATDLVADVSTAFTAISHLAGWSTLAIASLLTLQVRRHHFPLPFVSLKLTYTHDRRA